MASTAASYGVFGNGIPFARIAAGPKSMLVFMGGPGNVIPRGLGLQMLIGGFFKSVPDYTVHLVSRKSGLAQGYTTRDMSHDYADLICREFGGHVDAVVGLSYGGMIEQHFAADHPDLSGRHIIAMATHRLTDSGGQLDLRYAELLSQGKRRAAMASYGPVFAPPGVGRSFMTALVWLLAPALVGPCDSAFRSDVLIEAQAEVNHDAGASLPRIKVPVLVAVGGNDPFFTPDSVRELAELVPSATVRIYPGKGHDIANEKQFGEDAAAFLAGEPLPALDVGPAV